jgi:hypothetical protein
MLHLSLATNSLSRFQRLAFPEREYSTTLSPLQQPPLPKSSTQSRSASFPSPTPSPPFPQAILHSPNRPDVPTPTAPVPSLPAQTPSNTYHPSGRKRLYREDSPEPSESPRIVRNVSPCTDNSKRSLSPESECCGGILDCRDLIEEDRDNEDKDQAPRRLSIMRTTSEQSYVRKDH